MLKIAYFNAASELDNTISLGSLFHLRVDLFVAYGV